ncbi:MAG: hypothetical protein ABH816_00725 [Candidatus Levyibacteriota bacterium]
MAMSKFQLLEKAVDITKEYARSGSNTPLPDIILEQVYEKLKQLNNDLKNEDE